MKAVRSDFNNNTIEPKLTIIVGPKTKEQQKRI